MSIIAIGDIHGCARTLDTLLQTLAPTPEETLLFVGDYIDRGPDSKGVIDRLIQLKKEHPCIFLRGNHEDLLLRYLDHGEFDLWAINGGMSTLASYGLFEKGQALPEKHVRFVRDTVLYHETEKHLFVHAGIRPHLSVGENLMENDPAVFLWERSHLKAEQTLWEKTVVCGHTPVSQPVSLPHLINIDTGCVFYTHPHLGHLTAVRLPERAFVRVPYVD